MDGDAAEKGATRSSEAQQQSAIKVARNGQRDWWTSQQQLHKLVLQMQHSCK